MNKKICSPATMEAHISNIPTCFCGAVHQHLVSQVSDYYLAARKDFREIFFIA